MSAVKFSLLALLFSGLAYSSTEKKLIPVRVDFVEALAPKDTTSSLRFQTEYEQAITSGKTLLEKKLAGCGYALEYSTTFFDANDPLQAKEAAEKSNQNGSWAIVGPRRSNHYILLAKGSALTPTISLMASATEINELGNRHLSLSPTNDLMAKAAAYEAKSRVRKNLKYISIISEDCVSCVDFASLFDKHAKKIGIKNIAEFKIKGETPVLQDIIEKASELKPTIILLPNYSKVSGQVIAAISTKLRDVLFVGSDGWGDSSFGFLQNDLSVQTAKGITVRGFPPVKQALSTFPLGREISKNSTGVPSSGPGVAILKSLDGISEILCESKPRTKEAFASAFEKLAKKKLSSPFGVSIYKLSASNISYEKKAAVK